MKITVRDSLESIPATEWNNLVSDNNPFLRHEFLAALERHHCVGGDTGWQPQHLVIHDDGGRLIAASPLYLKHHSYGEFVFDWSWADAYQRHRLQYYPKLVCAIPFTPMSGRRLLTAPGQETMELELCLIKATQQFAIEQELSSIHWLFPTFQEKQVFTGAQFVTRMGCQYHWHNAGYESFDHFLSGLSSRKRKNILKERDQVKKAGIVFRILHGDEVTAHEWHLFHNFYCEIYQRKWGLPSLTPGFFVEIGKTLAAQTILVLAYQDGDCIAGALNFRSQDTLYGRHWGCSKQIPGLHFETCYYQGLEYCIRQGLQRFEPGAQGEHKISRGFLPTPTWSAHWLAQPAFHDAINDFCQTEAVELERMMQEMLAHSPYRQSD